MSILDHYGEVLLQQHEGNRQITSAVAEGTRVLVRRVAKLLMTVHGRVSGEDPSR